MEHAKDPRGRHAILDSFAKAKVIGLISAGVSQRTAALHVGVSPSTITKALRRDPEFARKLDEAVTMAEILPLAKIVRASDHSWRAAAWLYQNVRPETYLTRRRARLRLARQEERERRRREQEGQENHEQNLLRMRRCAAEFNELTRANQRERDDELRQHLRGELDYLLGRKPSPASAAGEASAKEQKPKDK